MSGPTARATFDGSVHGVVVQASSDCDGSSSSRNRTVTAGSARGRNASSSRASKFDSGVWHRVQYATTFWPS